MSDADDRTRTSRGLTPSTEIYLALVLVLALLAAVNIFLPQGSFLPIQELPASRPVLALANAGLMLVVYGGMGFLGLTLSRKLGFAELWDQNVTNRERLVLPTVAGAGMGALFILTDGVFSQFHGLGALPHPPFPTSLVASGVAGIGEEILFRLFFIPFWVWIISIVILRGRWQEKVFWVVAVASAVAFSASHLPSVIYLFDLGGVGEVPWALMVELLLLNGGLSLVAAWLLRKYGFLAAVGVHFWTDVVWHVIWGAVGF